MKPFIIAEIGVNHDGRLAKALKLVDSAVRAGADAVKFQSFAAARLASPLTPKVAYQIERDAQRTHYEMLNSLELSFEEQKILYDYCNKVGIEFLSTPYSQTDAVFLNSLGVRKFKVCSADIVDIPLHKLISGFGKLTLISTGMASTAEIAAVANIYKSAGTPFVLLHTTSEYPASHQNANIKKLHNLELLEPDALGYSDHTADTTCSLLALSFGCTFFEKHLTIDKSDLGPDHSASLNALEFTDYVSDLHKAFVALGDKDATPTSKELDMAMTSRKSLHYARDLKTGEELELTDVAMLRPFNGLPWSQVGEVVGKKLLHNVLKYQPVNLSDVNE